MCYNGSVNSARSFRPPTEALAIADSGPAGKESTLRTMLARHAVLLTPSVSLRLSLFPCRKQNQQSCFHSPYTLPSSVSRKSFACHSYENIGAVGVFFPFWNRTKSGEGHSQNYSTSFFSDSCALFCTHKKLNPFLFKQFRTLLQKHPGWGYLPLSRLRPSDVQTCGRFRCHWIS